MNRLCKYKNMCAGRPDGFDACWIRLHDSCITDWTEFGYWYLFSAMLAVLMKIWVLMEGCWRYHFYFCVFDTIDTDGKIVLCLEGGYNLENISSCTRACLEVLVQHSGAVSPPTSASSPPCCSWHTKIAAAVHPDQVSDGAKKSINAVLKVQRPLWPSVSFRKDYVTIWFLARE